MFTPCELFFCQCLGVSATLTFFQMRQSMLRLANVETCGVHGQSHGSIGICSWVCQPHPKTQRVQRTSAALLAAVPGGEQPTMQND